MKLGNYEVEWNYYASETGIVDTICKIIDLDDVPRFGYATCSPADKFIKDIGRKLSLTRALKNMNLDKNERTQIWKDYFRKHIS